MSILEVLGLARLRKQCCHKNASVFRFAKHTVTVEEVTYYIVLQVDARWSMVMDTAKLTLCQDYIMITREVFY